MKTNFKSGAKMSLTREPALPSKCINCGFSANGKKEFLDVGASEDYYGAIVFCIDCCREMAVSLGFITPYQRDQAIEQMEAAVADSVLAKEKLKAIENVIEQYGISNLDDLLASAERLNSVSDVASTEAESRDSVSEESSDRFDESPSKF